MGSTTKKLMAAIACASRDNAFVQAHPKYRLMARERLYHVLAERGYVWNAERETWEPRLTLQLRGNAPVDRLAQTSPVLAGVFFLRIMALPDDLLQIEADLMVFAEIMGWQVVGEPREYQDDPSSNYIRKQYTIKRG